MKTLKGLLENYTNMNYREHFLIEREGKETTISGKYNNLKPFYFRVTTKYFNKLCRDHLGYVLKPERIYGY